MADADPFAGIEDVFPASPGQAGMLFETLANPEYSANKGLMIAHLPADLDVARFQDAWAQVIARHQSLRSRMLWEGLSAPVLVVEQEVTPAWERLDWRGIYAVAALDALSARLQSAPFDLAQAPTTRQVLAQCDDGYRFVWLVHHALLDDWSVEVVFRETAVLYAGEALPPAMPYRDFADWRAGQEDDGYWTQLMQGFEEPTRLGFAGGGTQGQAHVVSQRQLPIEPLFEVAGAMRVTLGAVLTTVWSLVVQRFSGGSDVAFGLATTERPAELPGADQAVGMFVATQPVRLELDANATLQDLILARQADLQEAQGRPAPLLADLPGGGGDMPFDTILAINETGMGGGQNLYSEVLGQNHSSLPLALVMRPEETLGLIALWSPDRFAAADIETVLEVLETALRALPDGLDAPAAALGVANAAETGAELGAAPLIPQAMQSADPQAIAVIDHAGTMTYADLTNRADTFAAQMQAASVGPGDRVAVLMPRGADCIAAFLAAWRIGAAYIPLDPAQPDARLQQMVDEGQAAVIFADTTLATRLDGPVVIADAGFADPFIPQTPKAEDAAYIMFTSGSTGVPKGVVVSHGNLAASTAARPAWYDDRPERYMVVSPFGFDSSVAGIYWTLVQGGTLVVPQADVVQDIPALAKLIAEQGATHMLCLPSLYDLLLGQARALGSLRCVIVAGEAAPPELIARHHRLRPGARLVNEYGPTEATVWCAAAELDGGGGPVPIGRAIPGVTLSIRDDLARPVPGGLAGELWVAGPGVARYLHGEDPAFVLHGGQRHYRTGDQVRRRPDGQIVFLGRTDQQVKIGGQRIELGEVEARLRALPGVGAAAVVAVGPPHALQLVGYVTGVAPDLGTLPPAMRPSHLIKLEHLPQTATGKVDRKALTTQSLPSTAAAEHPAGETEIKVAALWQDMLGLPTTPDVTTGFFALGGTSLMAMRLVAAIAEAFDQQVSLPQILGPANTIRNLATLLETGEAAPVVVSDAGYPAPATESQKALWLAAKMRPGVPHFNLAKAVRLHRTIGLAELEAAADRLIQQHGILGCTLTLADRALTLTPVADRPPIAISAGPVDVDDWLQTTSAQPFAMDGSPLWRINAVVEGTETVVSLGIHHTISDGWSLDILMQDLVAVLTKSTLPDPTQNFASVLPPADRPEDIAAWRKMLDEAVAGPRLPADRPMPDRSDSAGILATTEVNAQTFAKVQSIATEEGTSLFAALWAATGLWLARETGVSDSLMAVSNAGRSAPGFERTVGCFTKTLPYRFDVRGKPDLQAATAQAGAQAARIMALEDVSIGSLPLPPTDAPRGYLTSFTPIALQFNDFDWTAGAELRGVETVEFTPTLTSYFEVSIEWAVRRGALQCAILARADLYDQETVEGWVARLAGSI